MLEGLGFLSVTRPTQKTKNKIKPFMGKKCAWETKCGLQNHHQLFTGIGRHARTKSLTLFVGSLGFRGFGKD